MFDAPSLRGRTVHTPTRPRPRTTSAIHKEPQTSPAPGVPSQDDCPSEVENAQRPRACSQTVFSGVLCEMGGKGYLKQRTLLHLLNAIFLFLLQLGTVVGLTPSQ